MANDRNDDKKDVNQSKDVGPEINESVNLASVGGGAGGPPTPTLLANCTSAVMMDQVLGLHVSHGNELLTKFRSGMDNRRELQQHLKQNSELIPYLNHYAKSKKQVLESVDTESSLPQTGIS